VQRAALKTWAGEGEFLANLAAESEISAVLDAAELQDACGLERHFRHVDKVFRDLGL
jgi:adenylosuccinate lyase